MELDLPPSSELDVELVPQMLDSEQGGGGGFTAYLDPQSHPPMGTTVLPVHWIP